MSFDRIAPLYRWLETIAFGNKLQIARVTFLDQITRAKRALVVGEGDGRFLRELLGKHPNLEVDCIDASARMLQLARARTASNTTRVRFLRQDLLTWSPSENIYDLIVTHFFLDCFTEIEIEKIVATLAHGSTRDAVWLLADFSVPSAFFANLHARTWLWSMHYFFRIVAGISARRLTNPSRFLEAHGFRRERSEYSRFGLVKSEMWRR